MSLSFVLRLNALVCIVCGLLMAVYADTVNDLMANQYSWLMAPSGYLLVAYGVWLALAARRKQANIKELMIFIAGDYSWTLLIILLISTGQVIVAPMGIRVAMVTALFTAAMGALQFRHYKLLAGKF
ncbi:MAG TPA: hypothetical protein DE179_13895 [Oceanospirillaceae bacterium]|nr:hypothetical protein [Oceanospirillaceae bacterium]